MLWNSCTGVGAFVVGGRDMKHLDTQKAEHAGWLLACDAPANLQKGRKLFGELDEAGREIALEYRDKCLKLYSGG